MFQKWQCVNPKGALDELLTKRNNSRKVALYILPNKKENLARISFRNGFIPDFAYVNPKGKPFFEFAESVISYQPLITNMNYNLIGKELDKSINLIKNKEINSNSNTDNTSYISNNPYSSNTNTNNNTNKTINTTNFAFNITPNNFFHHQYNQDMSSQDIKDLKVIDTALYNTNTIRTIYHQVLYVCAESSNGAYHFIIDRSARDSSHDTSMKEYGAIMQVLKGMNFMATFIRVINYNFSEKCGNKDDRPDSVKFKQNLVLFEMGKKVMYSDIKKFLGKDSVGLISKAKTFFNNFWNRSKPSKPKVSPKKVFVPKHRSFTKLKKQVLLVDLLKAVERYAYRFKFYEPANNCQHFATGFYNEMTGRKFPYFNRNFMRHGNVNKMKFSLFFRTKDGKQINDKEYKRKANKKWKSDPKWYKSMTGFLKAFFSSNSN